MITQPDSEANPHQSSHKKRATLEDVARAAGVGPMTVSRTINGHPYVSEATAKKVRAAIRKLDYRPNHAARMLTGQLSRSIGLIVPDIADTFFSVVIHAIQETARESGYLVWLAASNEDPAIEAAQVEMMTHQPVDGILLVPVDPKNDYLKHVAARSLPVVTIDRPIEVAKTDSVGVRTRPEQEWRWNILSSTVIKESFAWPQTRICKPSKNELQVTGIRCSERNLHARRRSC